MVMTVTGCCYCYCFFSLNVTAALSKGKLSSRLQRQSRSAKVCLRETSPRLDSQTQSIAESFDYSFFTHASMHVPTHSPNSATPPTHLAIHSLTHSSTHPPTHSLTHRSETAAQDERDWDPLRLPVNSTLSTKVTFVYPS